MYQLPFSTIMLHNKIQCLKIGFTHLVHKLAGLRQAVFLVWWAHLHILESVDCWQVRIILAGMIRRPQWCSTCLPPFSVLARCGNGWGQEHNLKHSNTFFNPLLATYLMITHWPKEVAWLWPMSEFGHRKGGIIEELISSIYQLRLKKSPEG